VIGFRTIFLVGAILEVVGFILVLFLVKESRRQPDQNRRQEIPSTKP
jgi:hypothetical protein